MEEFSDLLLSAGNLTAGDLPARKKLLEASIEAFDRASGILDIMEEDAILEQKLEKRVFNNGKSNYGTEAKRDSFRNQV